MQMIPMQAGVGATRDAPAAISVRNLRMGYGERVLLEDASFDVQRGEIVVILGGSGSGKSSLMKARDSEKNELQRGLGVMYQSGALFGSLTVLENVRFPLDQFTDLALAD